MKSKKEVWKDVKNYEGIYQVSNLGRVKSLDRTRKGRLGNICNIKGVVLKGGLGAVGYFTVNLCVKSKSKSRYIHQLVSEAFLNHKPDGHKLVVNHINFDKLDNRVENLELVTSRENCNMKHIKSKSKHVGVTWGKTSKKWVSTINIYGTPRHLGCFDDELEAAKAYQDKLKQIILKNKIYGR